MIPLWEVCEKHNITSIEFANNGDDDTSVVLWLDGNLEEPYTLEDLQPGDMRHDLENTLFGWYE